MDRQALIEKLSGELTPVKPVKPRAGMTILLASALAAALAVVVIFGVRTDILAGAPGPIVVIRAGLLILLGLATGFAATAAARPSVGRGYNGWGWALAAALVMPAAATVLLGYHMIMGQPFAPGDMEFSYWPHCLGIGGGGGLLIGAGLTAWLRRGAPTSLDRAGWLTGLAAGSFGTFAYSLDCPSNSIYYVGIFYTLTVAICAVAGRLIVPRFIRW